MSATLSLEQLQVGVHRGKLWQSILVNNIVSLGALPVLRVSGLLNVAGCNVYLICSTAIPILHAHAGQSPAC